MADLMVLLPDWFKRVEEFKQIMRIEGKTLDELEADIKRVYKNHFIKTADQEIISDYETWMEIRRQACETLDYRRERVLQKLNTVPPFTIWFFRDRLDWILGKDGYTLSVDSSICLLQICIMTDRAGAVDMVFELVLDVVPAHMCVIISRKHMESYQVDIRYDSRFTARGDFYPRYNLEYLYLDNSWLLNDRYKLSGFKSGSQLDFYPVNMGIGTEVKAVIKTETQLTVENDLWYLDDTWGLDGTKLLDADTFYYDL